MVAADLQGVAALVDGVVGAADPDGAVGFEHATHRLNPSAVEPEVLERPAAAIPVALVDADALARVDGEAVVGEIVGRVGEHEVDRLCGQFAQQLEAVGVVERVARLLEVRCDRHLIGSYHMVARRCASQGERNSAMKTPLETMPRRGHSLEEGVPYRLRSYSGNISPIN